MREGRARVSSASASGRLSARPRCWSTKRAASPPTSTGTGAGDVAHRAHDVEVALRERVARRAHLEGDGAGRQALRRASPRRRPSTSRRRSA